MNEVVIMQEINHANASHVLNYEIIIILCPPLLKKQSLDDQIAKTLKAMKMLLINIPSLGFFKQSCSHAYLIKENEGSTYGI